MSLRLAFDLDGVLADMEAELARQAQTLFGERITRRMRDADVPLDRDAGAGEEAGESGGDATVSADSVPPLEKLRLTARETRRLWRHVEKIEGFWESLHEIEEGAVARLGSLAAERRWEVIFLTRRPDSAGSTAQVQTQRWLQSKGFPLPSVYVVQGSRGHIASALALDIVVDDRPENCLDVVVDSRARAFLIWRDDERQLPATARRLGIGVVKSVADCLDVLAEAAAPNLDEEGVMDRIRRLLGLKSAAGASLPG